MHKTKLECFCSLMYCMLTFFLLRFLQVADGTKHLPHLWDLCSNEIVVRSAKHILKVIRIFLLTSASFYVILTEGLLLETSLDKNIGRQIRIQNLILARATHATWMEMLVISLGICEYSSLTVLYLYGVLVYLCWHVMAIDKGLK